MKTLIKSGLVLKAIAFSALLNLCLVFSAFASIPNESHNLFVKIADAIAAPPGVISELAFTPKQHTVHAFVLAAAESLVCSFVFYALVAWAVLELLRLRKIHKNRKDE
jgi:hypothetical protein